MKHFERITDVLKSYDFKTLNFRLIFYVIALSVIGVLVVNSASEDSSLTQKQIIGVVVGIFIMLFFALVKYDFICRYYWIIYIVSILALLAVLSPLGVSVNGAQRWINVGIRIQPSELAKLLLIIFFSALLAKNFQSLGSWKFLLFVVILAIIPLAMIFKEPDLSTTIVTFVIICAILLSSQIHSKYIKRTLLVVGPIVVILGVLIAVLPADHNIISKYQYNRIVAFFDEDNEDAEDQRYQQENSVIAIAGGSITGKGLNNNSVTSVKNAEYLSEPETDFIFTIVGEELGFAGSMAVIVLLSLIFIECFRIGMRAREQLGKSIAIGFGTWIGFQSFVNMAVVTMLLPNTGLTLPFVSAGLSSLVVLYIGVGIVLNIGLRKNNTY